jgi:hypothetical protein
MQNRLFQVCRTNVADSLNLQDNLSCKPERFFVTRNSVKKNFHVKIRSNIRINTTQGSCRNVSWFADKIGSANFRVFRGNTQYQRFGYTRSSKKHYKQIITNHRIAMSESEKMKTRPTTFERGLSGCRIGICYAGGKYLEAVIKRKLKRIAVARSRTNRHSMILIVVSCMSANARW